jgi:hypothetical protein
LGGAAATHTQRCVVGRPTRTSTSLSRTSIASSRWTYRDERPVALNPTSAVRRRPRGPRRASRPWWLSNPRPSTPVDSNAGTLRGRHDRRGRRGGGYGYLGGDDVEFLDRAVDDGSSGALELLAERAPRAPGTRRPRGAFQGAFASVRVYPHRRSSARSPLASRHRLRRADRGRGRRDRERQQGRGGVEKGRRNAMESRASGGGITMVVGATMRHAASRQVASRPTSSR